MRIVLFAMLAATVGSAAADTPSFDRPGIAFSSATLPAGAFDWEQGLPDFARDKDAGITASSYSADTLFRVGLTQSVELRIGVETFDHLEIRSGGVREVSRGYGDSSIGFKIALPSSSASFSWAALVDTSLPTGRKPFRSSDLQYRFGVTGACTLNETQAIALYGDVTRAGAQNSFTLSPNYSFKLSSNVGAFVELGWTHTEHESTDKVAGGGLTWMARSNIQLDAFADWGLDRRSTDLQAGVGLSVYFD